MVMLFKCYWNIMGIQLEYYENVMGIVLECYDNAGEMTGCNLGLGTQP